MRDDPASALLCFDRAAELLSHEPPATLAQLQSNRAEALMDLHRFDEAEGALRDALEQFEGQQPHRAAALVSAAAAIVRSAQVAPSPQSVREAIELQRSTLMN